MNIRKLIKMLETETDKEKIDKLIQKINSVMIKKGELRMSRLGYLRPLEVESHICRRDAFEEGYFDRDWGYKWGYPVRNDCVYIQPDYAGIEIVLSMNEQYVVSCIIKTAYIEFIYSGINAPAADQKKIGELFKNLGASRSQYNNCSFCLIDK